MRTALLACLFAAALGLSCHKEVAERAIPTAVRETRGTKAAAIDHDIELRGSVTYFDEFDLLVAVD